MKLCDEGKRLVEYVLTDRAWSLEDLSKKSEIGITTVKKFSSGKKIGRINFVKLCGLLEINWEVASGQTIYFSETLMDHRPSSSQSKESNTFDSLGDESSLQKLNQEILLNTQENFDNENEPESNLSEVDKPWENYW